jgi:hypothetical protein
VGSSDAKIFLDPASKVPSTQNDWTQHTKLGDVDAVMNGDIAIRAVDTDGDGRVDGYDINGDGRSEFNAKEVTPDTSAVEAPVVGKPIGETSISAATLFELEEQAVTRFGELLEKEPDPQNVGRARVSAMFEQVRSDLRPLVEGKLISVDEANRFNLESDGRSTRSTALLGRIFRLDQLVPRGPTIDPRNLYVNADALLGGDWGSRYRDLVFFTTSTDGTVARLADRPGTVAHLPTANSWATPAELVRRHNVALESQ